MAAVQPSYTHARTHAQAKIVKEQALILILKAEQIIGSRILQIVSKQQRWLRQRRRDGIGEGGSRKGTSSRRVKDAIFKK